MIQSSPLQYKFLPVKYIFMLILICEVWKVQALQTPIIGTVHDIETKAALPFANIAVLGTNRGSVSNNEGQYVIDQRDISPNDSIMFSYVGYEVLVVKAGDLSKHADVYLHPAAIELQAVQVSNRDLSATEIIKKVERNYAKNYHSPTNRQRVFIHKYEKVPFAGRNQIVVKHADFVGLDKNLAEEILAMLPKEFVEYQDAIVNLYSNNTDWKMVPVEAISLEEGSMKDLGTAIEAKLANFFNDLEKTRNNSEQYYQVRSGILSHKIKPSELGDSLWSEHKKDSLNYSVETRVVKDDVVKYLTDYASLESKNWEFITNRTKYRYSKDDVTFYNNEMVYKISFKPKSRGLFEGTAYISTTSFAVLQIDYAYADDKQSEKFKLLGISHSMDYKEGRVIFERGEHAYFPKYIYATQRESAMISRDLTIMKKQKRPLKDKELSEIKLELQLQFDIESYREMLVLEQEEIPDSQFEDVEQPALMKFRKAYAYNPAMWKNGTVIVPSSDLQKYTRK